MSNAPKPVERSPWLLASDDLISVLLQPDDKKAKDAFEWSTFERGLAGWHFPPLATEPHRALYMAISACYAEGLPIHDTTVLDHSFGKVRLDQYHQLASLFDALRGDKARFRANVDLVIERGTAFSNIGIIEDAAKDLRAGKPNQDVVDALIVQISADSSHVVKEVTLTQALAYHEAYMSSLDAVRMIRTGIPWWDKYTGGFRAGLMYWLAAPYKARKSSIAKNLILGALANNPNASITFATLEGDQNRIVAELRVMLAQLRLLELGLYHKTYKNKAGDKTFAMHQMSSSLLMTTGNRYRMAWQKEQVEAMDWATEKLKSYGDRLRIYDATRRGGRITDLKSVRRMISADKAMYGVNIVVLDYLQRMAGRGTIFERTSENSLALQDEALVQEVGLVVLAQQNEETIKSGGDSWSPGIKGGGDAPATADYLVTLRYMIDDNGTLTDDDRHLSMTMKLSRHGGMGPGTRENLPIDPYTGLLIPPEYQDQFYHPTSMTYKTL